MLEQIMYKLTLSDLSVIESWLHAGANICTFLFWAWSTLNYKQQIFCCDFTSHSFCSKLPRTTWMTGIEQDWYHSFWGLTQVGNCRWMQPVLTMWILGSQRRKLGHYTLQLSSNIRLLFSLQKGRLKIHPITALAVNLHSILQTFLQLRLVKISD